MNDKPIFCCRLEITGTEHGEWQGSVRTDEWTKPFRSVLELLCLLQSQAGPPMPGRKPESK